MQRQPLESPLKGSFFFFTFTTDKKKPAILDLELFLACQTSTGDELSEEAVHLAAGMLEARYRSIVTRTIKDQCAPVVAKSFTTILWKDSLRFLFRMWLMNKTRSDCVYSVLKTLLYPWEYFISMTLEYRYLGMIGVVWALIFYSNDRLSLQTRRLNQLQRQLKTI